MVSFVEPVSELSCFGRCCKWLLYIFNLLLMLSSTVAIAVGVWAKIDDTSNRIVVLTNTEMYIKSALCLVSGGTASLFVSILGCCGVRYENKFLIVCYAVLLLSIFVTEFASGVIALAFYVQMEVFANMEMRDAVILKYGQSSNYEATDAFNYMQTEFDCCGFEGTGHDAAQLYQISIWFDTNWLQVPPSCCKRNEEGEPINQEKCQTMINHDMSFVNNIGCKGAVLEQAGRFATYLAGVGIGLSIMQLMGLILTFCLYRLI